jgi:hypothetical protein
VEEAVLHLPQHQLAQLSLLLRLSQLCRLRLLRHQLHLLLRQLRQHQLRLQHLVLRVLAAVIPVVEMPALQLEQPVMTMRLRFLLIRSHHLRVLPR